MRRMVAARQHTIKCVLPCRTMQRGLCSDRFFRLLRRYIFWCMPNATCRLTAVMANRQDRYDSAHSPFHLLLHHPMLYIILKTVHLLSLIVWLGGMAFAHFFLRPAAAQLQPPQRLPLMRDVLQRFFSTVLIAIVLILVSGVGMIGLVHQMAAQAGAKAPMPVSWIVMAVLGLVMMAVFGHIRFALFKRLDAAVDAKDWPAGGKAMDQIRKWVALNLALGTVIVVILRLPL